MMIDPKVLGDCGGCSGDIPGISESIIQASKLLINGHMGLSELFKQLANSAANPEHKASFTAQSQKHERMARETAQVSVPDVGGSDGSRPSEVRNGGGQDAVEPV